MTRTPTALAVSAALLATLSLAACKKHDTTPPADTSMGAPAATAPATAPEPAPLPSATPDTGTATAPAGEAQVAVSSVDLGSAIGADNRITTSTTTFAPKDTVYVTVNTIGAASKVPVTAKWTYQDGQVVGTETKTLDASGPSTVEFHASKPSGWPAGTYTAEISVGGNVVQTKQFTVR